MDHDITEEQLRAKLVAAIGDSQKQAWARERGISPSFLSEMLNGRRAPSRAVTEELGYERLVIYRRKEI